MERSNEQEEEEQCRLAKSYHSRFQSILSSRHEAPIAIINGRSHHPSQSLEACPVLPDAILLNRTFRIQVTLDVNNSQDELLCVISRSVFDRQNGSVNAVPNAVAMLVNHYYYQMLIIGVLSCRC